MGVGWKSNVSVVRTLIVPSYCDGKSIGRDNVVQGVTKPPNAGVLKSVIEWEDDWVPRKSCERVPRTRFRAAMILLRHLEAWLAQCSRTGYRGSPFHPSNHEEHVRNKLIEAKGTPTLICWTCLFTNPAISNTSSFFVMDLRLLHFMIEI